MDTRIYERDLWLPALYLISLKNGEITTTELSKLLREILKPTGEDLKLLSNRSDDHFSQIVRNLTGSKRSFVKNKFIQRDAEPSSPLAIGEKGRVYLEEHKLELTYLLTNDFDYADIKDNLKKVESTNSKRLTFDENIIIHEGEKRMANVKVYERSTKLRNHAIDHFTQNGHIQCKCCTFDFKDFYGPEGDGFIEVHHKKPIFQYEDNDLSSTIDTALSNLAPVCSNCHRMIHKNWNKPIEIQALIGLVAKYGKFRTRP